MLFLNDKNTSYFYDFKGINIRSLVIILVIFLKRKVCNIYLSFSRENNFLYNIITILNLPIYGVLISSDIILEKSIGVL